MVQNKQTVKKKEAKMKTGKEKKERFCYAKIDIYQVREKTLGFGFANSKTVVAFPSPAERKKFLEGTTDLSAHACTRRTALRYAEPIYGDRDSGIGVEIFSHDTDDTTITLYKKLRD